MKFLNDRRFVALLRIALGVLFIAAALPKLRDPEAFAKSVENYRILPEVAARALALVLPTLELVAGALLLAGFADAGASLVVFALMVVFTAAVGSALARGLDISCGCFETEGGSKVGMKKIVENVFLTWAAWRVYRGDRSFLSLSSLGRARRAATAALACVIALVGGRDARAAEPAAGPTATSAGMGARPFLWIIERERPAFLFGTIHLPDPRVTKTPDVVNAAFSGSDVFVTEIPLDDETQRQVAAESMRSETETLAMILPSDVREKSDRFVRSQGFTLAEFSPLEVYAFALQLPLLEYAMNASPPLDAVLHARAVAQGKKLGSLESCAEQLAIFESLSRADQIELLRVTLDDLEVDSKTEGKNGAAEKNDADESSGPSEKIEDLVQAYLSGDDARLERDLFDPMREGGPLEKRLLHEMLDVRNVRLAERIDRELDTTKDRRIFYAIGAGHMVGKQGIVERLRAEGWTIRRLTARDVEVVKAALK